MHDLKYILILDNIFLYWLIYFCVQHDIFWYSIWDIFVLYLILLVPKISHFLVVNFLYKLRAHIVHSTHQRVILRCRELFLSSPSSLCNELFFSSSHFSVPSELRVFLRPYNPFSVYCPFEIENGLKSIVPSIIHFPSE